MNPLGSPRNRTVAALIGLGLSLLAVVRNDKRIAWVAIAFLAVALLLRLWARRIRERELDRMDDHAP